MEIQIGNVNFQPTKTGKDKWVVATNEGNLSVWEGKIAEQLNKLIGQTVNVEVRQPAPNTNYLPTITGMVSVGSVIKNIPSKEPVRGFDGVALKEVQNGERSLNGQEQKSVAEEKFRTPKEMVATELVKAVIGQSHENVVLIDKAVGMYKEALELLG